MHHESVLTFPSNLPAFRYGNMLYIGQSTCFEFFYQLKGQTYVIAPIFTTEPTALSESLPRNKKQKIQKGFDSGSSLSSWAPSYSERWCLLQISAFPRLIVYKRACISGIWMDSSEVCVVQTSCDHSFICEIGYPRDCSIGLVTTRQSHDPWISRILPPKPKRNHTKEDSQHLQNLSYMSSAVLGTHTHHFPSL